MNQLEKELSRQIDELIVSCAIGMGCDEAELKRLASEYGNVAHSYTLSKNRVASASTRTQFTVNASLLNDDIVHLLF